LPKGASSKHSSRVLKRFRPELKHSSGRSAGSGLRWETVAAEHSPDMSRNMSPTPGNYIELRGTQTDSEARIGLSRTPSPEMMTEDAKFALGF
jgi:hypothetical protein